MKKKPKKAAHHKPISIGRGKNIMELEGVDLFQDLFLFRNLNFDETVALARMCRLEKVSGGTVLIEENSLGKALYLIKSGSVGVYKGENRKFLAKLGKGDLFGEMSLIEDTLTSATVKAEEDAELVVLDKDSFMSLMDSNEKLGIKVYRSFCRILSERLRKTSGDLLALAGSEKG